MKKIKSILYDILVFVAIISINYGVYQIYPPAMYIVAGGVCAFIGIKSNDRIGKK